MSNKKNILFVLPNLNGGGAERVAINYLRQLNFDLYRVTLLVFNKTDDLLSLIPSEVEFIDIKTNSTSKSWLPLIPYIKKLSPDVIFSTHSRVAVLLMLVKPFVKPFIHIARMQGSPSLDIKQKQYGKFNQWLYSLGFRSADIVIAQTNAMLADAIVCFKLERPKVKVLNNPIDCDYIDSQKNAIRSVFELQNLSAVASGRLSAEKGFDTIIKAIPAIIKTYPNFKLYILGDDLGVLDDLKLLVNRLRLQKHVKFEGFIKNPYAYYAHCDLFILSSRREGFPNVLLENYYLNSPIVSTLCVPIVQELIIDGQNGYICAIDDEVDLSEKIIKCLVLKRSEIDNMPYKGSRLDKLFE